MIRERSTASNAYKTKIFIYFLTIGVGSLRLTGDGIGKIIVNYFDAAGVKKLMSPHRIRHSGITALSV
ncbi:MAG: hypothetical protein RLZZ507_4154 [Cyanobacteriota bacterium]|jgi:site-specific recombinase XerD